MFLEKCWFRLFFNNWSRHADWLRGVSILSTPFISINSSLMREAHLCLIHYSSTKEQISSSTHKTIVNKYLSTTVWTRKRLLQDCRINHISFSWVYLINWHLHVLYVLSFVQKCIIYCLMLLQKIIRLPLYLCLLQTRKEMFDFSDFAACLFPLLEIYKFNKNVFGNLQVVVLYFSRLIT